MKYDLDVEISEKYSIFVEPYINDNL